MVEVDAAAARLVSAQLTIHRFSWRELSHLPWTLYGEGLAVRLVFIYGPLVERVPGEECGQLPGPQAVSSLLMAAILVGARQLEIGETAIIILPGLPFPRPAAMKLRRRTSRGRRNRIRIDLWPLPPKLSINRCKITFSDGRRGPRVLRVCG